MNPDRAIAEAESVYDEHLRQHGADVADHLGRHAHTLAHHGIHPEGFAVPLRPALITGAQLARFTADLTVVMAALLKVFFETFGGDVHRIGGLLRLDPAVVEILQRYFTPERETAQLFGRPDGFLVDGRIVYIEQNLTSGSGGLPGIDALTRVFADVHARIGLQRELALRGLSPLDAYEDLFRTPAYGATIGYIDAVMADGSLWDDDGLRFVESLRERGIDLVDLTNRELALRADGLYADGIRIDHVYRGVAAVGLWHRTDELRTVYEACRRGLTAMTTSPYEVIYFDKQLLAYLSDPALAPSLTSVERATIARVLPWTRLLRDDNTSYRRRRVHIPSFCLLRQHTLVLKRGNGFASDAVVIGAETDEHAWEAAVRDGLDQGTWIVQELVEPAPTLLPYLIDGKIEWSPSTVMACPYVVRGRICAIAGRTSVPGGGRVLVGAGAAGSSAGVRTAFLIG